MRYTFRAYERLKREQHIDTLFRTGKAFSVFPVKLIYLLVSRGTEASPVRAGFSAPKRAFRKAVHRQRIKRLMREAWRLQKHRLYAQVPEDTQLHIFFLYTDKTLPGFELIRDAVAQAINILADKAAAKR